ncbi:hypothetical protein Nepgr_012456 [Nepenthes gracilis]|uniref:Transmembrane protein n=1 Tax=Nepenthes gracilis TaxID=150966 RepID=A0AAD3SGY2_NEPGR|nr:hypothetical protein Nepgr_012456 [Nepenthes gracilis]
MFTKEPANQHLLKRLIHHHQKVRIFCSKGAGRSFGLTGFFHGAERGGCWNVCIFEEIAVSGSTDADAMTLLCGISEAHGLIAGLWLCGAPVYMFCMRSNLAMGGCACLPVLVLGVYSGWIWYANLIGGRWICRLYAHSLVFDAIGVDDLFSEISIWRWKAYSNSCYLPIFFWLLLKCPRY